MILLICQKSWCQNCPPDGNLYKLAAWPLGLTGSNFTRENLNFKSVPFLSLMKIDFNLQDRWFSPTAFITQSLGRLKVVKGLHLRAYNTLWSWLKEILLFSCTVSLFHVIAKCKRCFILWLLWSGPFLCATKWGNTLRFCHELACF